MEPTFGQIILSIALGVFLGCGALFGVIVIGEKAAEKWKNRTRQLGLKGIRN